jgi:peptidoglycan L-alanyl-D-glutamate endopeptidase CwlK
MSGLLLSRIDATKLYPPFLAKLQAMLDELLAQGAGYWVISGFRSYQEQTELYAQGRAKPGAVVTNARAGQSSHNFGIAADLVRDSYIDRAGIQPDYRPASYDILGPAAARHGLVWGGTWQFKDLPHVQWPGYVTAPQLDPLRHAFEAGGLRAVWDLLDGVIR